MRVLLFHGYMLRGTGSNIYNVNLARALARLGHEVHLLCQDREVKIEGVQIHNPDIGGLLPVYVKDPYEGFEVKAFPELTEAELSFYIDANVAAVRAVAESTGGFDAALANHLVMGPAILARAEIGPFAAKIHGSALEYTVKPHPRFLPYAYEGMAAASGVLFGVSDTAIKALTGITSAHGLLALALSPWLLVALAASIVAFYASARGLQDGEAVPVIAVTGTAANIAGIAGGIVVFGDPMAAGPLGVTLQALAFVLVVVACALMPAPLRAVARPA